MPNLVSIILDNEPTLTKQIYLHFYDAKIHFTYYLSRMEPQITMAVLYADKKKPYEQPVSPK